MHLSPELRSTAAASESSLGNAVHPYLRDPERARALAFVAENSCGTEREWAAALGWTRSRVTRFLAALEKCGLAYVERSAYGTQVRIRSTSEPQPNRADSSIHASPGPRTVQSRTRVEPSAGPLEALTTRNSRPRDLERGDEYALTLISVMNEELGRLFPSEFRPVRNDNFASNQAASRLKAEFPLADAVDALRASIRMFNPSKHGSGNLPGTLKFFETGIRDRLTRSTARRHPPRETADKAHQPSIAIPKRSVDPGDRGTASPETIGSVMDSLQLFMASR